MAIESATRYLKTYGAVAVGLLGLVVAFNVVVDPYGVLPAMSVAGLNAHKPREVRFARLRKPFDVWRGHFDALVLGTSQVEQSFDPEYLAPHGVRLYNLGLSELRLYEMAMLLDHAARTGDVKLAMISVDFVRYDTPPWGPSFLPRDWNRARLVAQYGKSLTAFRTLLDSEHTIEANRSGQPVFEHLPGGRLNVEEMFDRAAVAGIPGAFDAIDAVYLNDTYRPYVKEHERLTERGFDHTDLRRLIRVARDRDVRLYLFIPPSHARQMEIIAFLGLLPLMEQWKTELVCTIMEVAGPGTHVELWDFSGYNAVTTEAVPTAGAPRPMQWYYDPVHFSIRTASAMMNAMLRLQDAQYSSLDAFGTMLTPTNVQRHFSAIRQSRDRYLTEHPDVSATLARLYSGPPRIDSDRAHAARSPGCAEARARR